MRTSMMGLSAATAVAISVVALPPAIAAHSASTQAAVAHVPAVAAAARPAAASVPNKVNAGSYPTNTTSVSIDPLTRTYPGPAKVTFTGRLALNDTGIQTGELRIFSVREHRVVATVSTNPAGNWHAKLSVDTSDWFYTVFSGDQSYQPALSGISKITIGNRPAVR